MSAYFSICRHSCEGEREEGRRGRGVSQCCEEEEEEATVSAGEWTSLPLVPIRPYTSPQALPGIPLCPIRPSRPLIFTCDLSFMPARER